MLISALRRYSDLVFLWAIGFILLTAGGLPRQAKADALDNWQIRRQLNTGAAVAYGNGRFVIVSTGAPSYCLVSTNGSDWKSYLPPETASFECLTFANGNFLLVLSRYGYPSGSGTAIYSSVDGISWVLRRFAPYSATSGAPFARAGGGNGLYVATGPDLILSTNLSDWEVVEKGPGGIYEFTYGKGLLVGTPWYGVGFITSADGRVWEYNPAPDGFHFANVRYANGRFAAFASADAQTSLPPATATSDDGINWIAAQLPDFTNSTRLVSANDKFFLLNTQGSPNQFFASTDALNWESHSFGTNVQITDLAFGANTYVAVGNVILQSSPVTNAPPLAGSLSIRAYPGLSITGTPGRNYLIEYTEDFHNTNNFKPLTNIFLNTSPFLWIDTANPFARPRFYRAVLVP